MNDGHLINHLFDENLANYAFKNADTKGRMHPFVADPLRTPYQRDRSRIIHSSAFRRLKGKTQVVPPESGDHARNRLTHTLEVTSIARDLARLLRLNEDFAECLALSHDLGHPPFGHAGEKTLNELLKPYGKTFEHNEQSRRVVMFFSRPYLDHTGLNLSHEILEGLKKHKKTLPYMEAELVDVADEIAYLSADLEDGLRGNFFMLSQLLELPLIQKALENDKNKDNVPRPQLVRAVIGLCLRELYTHAQLNLHERKIITLSDFQSQKERVVVFSDAFNKDFLELKRFLYKHYYKTPKVEAPNQKGQQILADLFAYFMENPQKLPKLRFDEKTSLERQVADYLAGMTNRYAEEVWERAGKG